MSKYQLILALCQEKGVKITNVEKELGFAKGSFKKMDTSKPSAEKIYALATYFDVPMEIFFDDTMGKAIGRYLDEQNGRYDQDGRFKTPMYEVAAGQGRVNSAYADEYIDEDLGDEYTLCTVNGDSMYPVLHDGDIVKVHLQTTVSSKDIAIVKVDGETATAKHIEVTDNGVWLRAENKEVFQDTFYTVQEVLSLPITIVGKVVELRREL